MKVRQQQTAYPAVGNGEGQGRGKDYMYETARIRKGSPRGNARIARSLGMTTQPVFFSPDATPLMLSSTAVMQFLARPLTRAEATQQHQLDEAERIDVRVPALDRCAQHRRPLQQRRLTGDPTHCVGRALVLGRDAAVDSRRNLLVVDEVGVQPRDGQVGLRQDHLGVVDQRPPERPAGVHVAEHRQPVRLGCQELGHRAAQAVPAGERVPALHPTEHPRDRPQFLDAAAPRSVAPAASRSSAPRSRRCGVACSK